MKDSLNSALTKLLPFQPALLAIGASIPATQSLIMSKSMSMMILQTVAGNDQLDSWFFWVAVLFTILATILWAAVTAHGVARFPTVVIVPVLQVCLLWLECVFFSYHGLTAEWACLLVEGMQNLEFNSGLD
jgi:hypothetical protein